MEKSFDLGRRTLDQETNIVQIIKSRRFFTEALRVLLPPEKWDELMESSYFICIDPDYKPEWQRSEQELKSRAKLFHVKESEMLAERDQSGKSGGEDEVLKFGKTSSKSEVIKP